MAEIKAFAGIRPEKTLTHKIAALPYDVYNRSEAKAEIEKEPLSFLKIDRAETQFLDEVDTYDPCVYERAKNTLWDMVEKGEFIKDPSSCFYLYELTMNGRTQTGLVACASIDDYRSGVIRKHENTRADKELDRIRHVDVCNAQTGPIFLTYRRRERITEIIEEAKQKPPVFDFTSPDGVIHRGWKIQEESKIEEIRSEFEKIPNLYIADGHHRAASAVRVGMKRREEYPEYNGTEEFNSFLSVLFPGDELMILDYNRVVKDLKGMTPQEFLERLQEKFVVVTSQVPVSPEKKGSFGMYLENQWYHLQAKEMICVKDPVEGLDVSVLQNEVLHPLLGIENPKTDQRISFVGGIRGLQELEKWVNQGWAVAFSMYPTSIEELFEVADAEKLMPPKSTWFEPKLRSGLFIHALK